MSKLLFDSQPLLIIPELACLIGVTESVVLQQVHYWIEINRRTDRNFKDGYHWTYNSYEDWQKQFPFWTTKTIKRAITNLETKKLLISDNYNRAKFDRTKWYRIDYKRLESLITSPLGHFVPMDEDILSQPIPETNQHTHFKGEDETVNSCNDIVFMTSLADVSKPTYRYKHSGKHWNKYSQPTQPCNDFKDPRKA